MVLHPPVSSSPSVACSATSLIIHDDPEGPSIVHLLHRDLLADHLLVGAVHALQAPLHTLVMPSGQQGKGMTHSCSWILSCHAVANNG